MIEAYKEVLRILDRMKDQIDRMGDNVRYLGEMNDDPDPWYLRGGIADAFSALIKGLSRILHVNLDEDIVDRLGVTE
jgi:hypothetical protein